MAIGDLLRFFKKESSTAQEIKQLVDEESKRTGFNFSLLATPAEGLSGRFTKMDKKKFGIIPGVF